MRQYFVKDEYMSDLVSDLILSDQPRDTPTHDLKKEFKLKNFKKYIMSSTYDANQAGNSYRTLAPTMPATTQPSLLKPKR